MNHSQARTTSIFSKFDIRNSVFSLAFNRWGDVLRTKKKIKANFRQKCFDINMYTGKDLKYLILLGHR
jgi:hypothetical protein